MDGAHTTNPTRGRNESHTHIGYGFLAFAVEWGVENKLDFSGQVCRSKSVVMAAVQKTMSIINDFMAEFLASHGGVDMSEFYEKHDSSSAEEVVGDFVAMMLEMYSGEGNQEKLHAVLPKRMSKSADGEQKIKDPNKPKRGKSAYMFFCAANREQAKSEILEETGADKVTVGDVAKRLGEWWKELQRDEDRKEEYDDFVAQADEDKERYKADMENYTEPTQEELKATVGEKKKRAPAGSGKKKDPDAPKRPKSAYIFFCKDWRETVKAELTEANGEAPSSPEVTSELAVRWNDLKTSTNPKDVVIRKKYEDMASGDKTRYEEEKSGSGDEKKSVKEEPVVKKPVVKKPVVKKPVEEDPEEEPVVKKPVKKVVVKKPVEEEPEEQEEPVVKKPVKKVAVKKPVEEEPEEDPEEEEEPVVKKPVKRVVVKKPVEEPVKPTGPKKKMGAFSFFCKEMRPEVVESNPDAKPAEITRELQCRWKSMDSDEQEEWKKRAAS